MSALSIQQVSRTFTNPRGGQTQALLPVDFEVRDNDFVTILGPSGCGKSTLLRIVAGLDTPTGGTVLLDGQPVSGPGADRGMVFQSYTLFPWLTIEQNVLVGLRLNGIRDKAFLRQRLEDSLRMAALWDEVKDHLGRPGTSLSGGQQQRLCIARALAVQPEVLLMDEPCSALDPIATSKIEELIQQLRRRYTVVIVTHNMQQAARCSDRTAFFYLGRLIEFAGTRDVFTNPANPQTEAYVSGRFG